MKVTDSISYLLFGLYNSFECILFIILLFFSTYWYFYIKMDVNESGKVMKEWKNWRIKMKKNLKCRIFSQNRQQNRFLSKTKRGTSRSFLKLNPSLLCVNHILQQVKKNVCNLCEKCAKQMHVSEITCHNLNVSHQNLYLEGIFVLSLFFFSSTNAFFTTMFSSTIRIRMLGSS